MADSIPSIYDVPEHMRPQLYDSLDWVCWECNKLVGHFVVPNRHHPSKLWQEDFCGPECVAMYLLRES